MNLLLTVFEIVAPVFLLAGIGFAWVKLGFEYRLEFVTRLGVTLAVPSLIFVALMQTQIPPGELTRFTLAAIAGHVGLAIVFEVFVRLRGLDRRTYLSPLIFGNTGNLGLPLCVFAFGQAGLGYAVIFLAVTALLSFTYGIYLVAGKGGFGKAAREPMVWGNAVRSLVSLARLANSGFFDQHSRTIGSDGNSNDVDHGRGRNRPPDDAEN